MDFLVHFYYVPLTQTLKSLSKRTSWLFHISGGESVVNPRLAEMPRLAF